MKVITGILSVCLVAIILAGAVFVAGCTPEQVTTTVALTTTATETLPPETITITPTPSIPDQIAKDITVAEGYNMIQDSGDNPEFIILDVRSAEEWTAAHIEDSALVDIHVSDTWLATVAALDKSYTYLIY